MDNTSRSERTRNLVIEAARVIIARDGPQRLTLDAIAREAGISKGGLMHQFGNKVAVIRALLENQIEYFEKFSKNHIATHGANSAEPHLAAQIAVAREAISQTQPSSVAFAILGMIGEAPELMSVFQDIDVKEAEAIKAEAADPDLAMLRLFAAQGMHLTTVFGIGRLSDEDRERLFARLADSSQWPSPAAKKA
jgi:AcrR family transcriptional regulator